MAVKAGKPARFDFQPAQLRVNADKWRIEFWTQEPATGEWERHRPTFNLNRIVSERERKQQAQRIIRRLNDVWLPGGYPYKSPEQIEHKARTVGEAFGAILKIKLATDKEETRRCYKSIGGVFERWMVANKFDGLDAKAFGPRHSLAYADYLLIERGLGAKHFNNSVNTLAGMFNVLIKREEIDRNPWHAVDRKKTTQKRRRMFTPVERRAVAKWALENDWWLFVAILFEYYGFIRWQEMRRLRFGDVQIGGETAFVRLDADKTKNGKARTVTIPDSVRPYYMDARFSEQPGNHFIFGKGWQPGTEQAAKNALNNRHLRGIAAAVESGAIQNSDGLSMYSWKDTGITVALDVAELMDVVSQADHADPRQTMTYRHAPKIIEGFKRRKNDLF